MDECRLLIEWIGYLGSILVVISLMMNSIIRLRWLNLAGATIFAVYGFIIGALPVGFLNLFLTFINIYHLSRIYKLKEFFKILHIRKENRYLDFFLDFYHEEVDNFFPGFYDSFKNQQFDGKDALFFLILRNAAVAGVFMGIRSENNQLEIYIDFVTPEYRDFKTGEYIYFHNLNYFRNMGIKTLITSPKSEKHYRYLKKMGFIEETTSDNKVILIKDIT
jgi:hypothetical protein